MLEMIETISENPICPHCEKELSRIFAKKIKQYSESRQLYSFADYMAEAHSKRVGLLAAFINGAREFCTRRGISYLMANTEVPVDQLVGNYLRKRGLVR